MSNTEPKMNLALTCGDFAGVGPDLVEYYLKNHSIAGVKLNVIGPESWLDKLPENEFIAKRPIAEAIHERIPGKPSDDSAKIAMQALEEAASGCVEGHYDGVISAPVSKYELSKVGFSYPGQTEFFAARWGGIPSMAFAGGRMRLVLATWHIPFINVPEALTFEVLQRAVSQAHHFGQSSGQQSPRIAVCGLNPHAGEQGLIGNEEQAYLDAWLTRLQDQFAGLTTTLPADTVFKRHLDGEFDVVVALYHDQGLAPLKTVEFDQAVNITLGLPWIRTSPDHGTAFGLAGKVEQINPASYVASIRECVRLTNQLKG